MENRKNDVTKALIVATIVATSAVITAAAAVSYILYKKYKNFKKLPFSSENDVFEDISEPDSVASDDTDILSSSFVIDNDTDD